MRIVFLTGGLGAGKSVAARFFEGRGTHVISADAIAQDALSPGSPVVAALIAEFGSGVAAGSTDSAGCPGGGGLGSDSLDGEGPAIDREALAALAFASPEAAARLNAIVHPKVVRTLAEELSRLTSLDDPPAVVVVEVPLLVGQSALMAFADAVLVIEAPLETRIARVRMRGIPEEDARRRIALQPSDQELSALATERIVNDSAEQKFFGRLEGFLDRLMAASSGCGGGGQDRRAGGDTRGEASGE
ncbi:MAG: dephospho-CoA kinase [Coriobacteriia bacterium]|nr:dephospho-CoA kinase [Coriobacteriia bacterium]